MLKCAPYARYGYGESYFIKKKVWTKKFRSDRLIIDVYTYKSMQQDLSQKCSAWKYFVI